jgi:hypothetical protein
MSRFLASNIRLQWWQTSVICHVSVGNGRRGDVGSSVVEYGKPIRSLQCGHQRKWYGKVMVALPIVL